MAVRITEGGTYGAPGRITNPSQLTLNVDSKLGCEKSRSVDENKVCTVQCYMFPLPDLCVNHIIEFDLILPRYYLEDGGMKIKIIDHQSLLFFGNQLNENNELVISWLEHAKYTLAVWFFAIREYFKVTTEDPWVGSILLRSEFRELHKPISTMNNSSSDDQISLIFGTGNTRGRRNYMEDVDFIFENIQINEKRSVAVFGVLDGHGGKDCAQYASEDVPIKITSFLRNSVSCAEALFKSFIETDNEFLESTMGGNSGSTANISIYDKSTNQFFVANTADTRAVLCRNGIALDLSVDRKATDPEEIVRITKAGGYVVGGRVLGCLAVSRAFGDSQLKKNKKGILVVNPEISRFCPGLQDEFVVIATDGLWDVMSSQAVVDMVREMLNKEQLIGSTTKEKSEIVQQLSYIANHIAVHAVTNLKSLDNVTVMIVLIQGGADRSSLIASFDEEEANIRRHHQQLLEDIGPSVVSGLSSNFGRMSAASPSFPSKESSVQIEDTGAVCVLDLKSSIHVVPNVATMIFKKQPSIKGNDLSDATSESSTAASSKGRNGSFDVKDSTTSSNVFVRSISTDENSPKEAKPRGIAIKDDDDLMNFLSDDANF